MLDESSRIDKQHLNFETVWVQLGAAVGPATVHMIQKLNLRLVCLSLCERSARPAQQADPRARFG